MATANAKHRNGDSYLPEDLKVIGVDIQDGPMMDLLDQRIFGELDDNMVRDIDDKGVLLTVVCRRQSFGLEVIDGRRRVIHAREVNKNRAKLGQEPIKVPVRVEQADDFKALELQLSLNTNRKEESQVTLALKVARFIDMMPKEEGNAIRRAALAANVSEAQVRNLCRFAKMDSSIHELVESGKLGFAAAVTLSADSAEVQLATAEKMVAEGQGGDINRAREVRQQIVKEKGLDVSPSEPKRGRPRKDTIKPSVGTIKDVLFLHGMDCKARSMSYDEVPEGFVDGVNWVMGLMDDVPDWLTNLIERVEGKEASRERKNSKYD